MKKKQFIVFTGPESCGKTHWSSWLSQKFNYALTKEFAREYLESIGGEYGYNTLSYIATEQQEIISKALRHSDKVTADTDLLTIIIWSEVRYQKVDPEIISLWTNSLPDKYILCYPDIPWEEDSLRENPNDRDDLFNLYKKKIEEYNIPYIILKGSDKEKKQILNNITISH